MAQRTQRQAESAQKPIVHFRIQPGFVQENRFFSIEDAVFQAIREPALCFVSPKDAYVYKNGQTLCPVTFNDTYTHVMSLLVDIPSETFRQTGTLPWFGREYALDDVLVYMYYGHKREHSAQIAVFRDQFA